MIKFLGFRIDPLTNSTREDLPQCLSQCLNKPLTRSDVKRNWTGLVSYFQNLNVSSCFLIITKEKQKYLLVRVAGQALIVNANKNTS